jgi:hypothetical protein
MTTTTSRRAILAGAVTLPALAVPATAPLAFEPNHPDAELLRLAVQLQEVERENAALLAIDRAFDDEWNAICSKAGLPKIAREDCSSSDEWLKYCKARWSLRPQRDDGGDLDDGPWKELQEDRIWPLAKEILSLKATTVAGLAVQFRAALLADNDLLTANGTIQEMFLKATAAFIANDVQEVDETVQKLDKPT